MKGGAELKDILQQVKEIYNNYKSHEESFRPAKLKPLVHQYRTLVVQYMANDFFDERGLCIASKDANALHAKFLEVKPIIAELVHQLMIYGKVGNVSLVIGMPHGPIDRVGHLRKLLIKAHRQFMPRETNVILIASGEASGSDDFEQALLGSHVERWDTHPPMGQRIAHGRAPDGFWTGRRRRDARCAGWFVLDPGTTELHAKLIYRDETKLPPGVARLLGDLFKDSDASSQRTAG